MWHVPGGSKNNTWFGNLVQPSAWHNVLLEVSRQSEHIPAPPLNW
jgi:hypothetical protein